MKIRIILLTFGAHALLLLFQLHLGDVGGREGEDGAVLAVVVHK